MDCRHARLLLDFTRPRGTELEPTETEALETHLADCPECGAQARAERRFDEHLSRAVRDVPVPDGLRDRLVGRLSAARDAWYRRRLFRAAGVLAAAVLLAAVGGLLIWHESRRPYFEVSEVSVDERPTNTPADVEGWFRKTYGLATVAPSDRALDYTWLTYYGLEEFQGRHVPMLLFAYNRPDRQARAKVYIVTDQEFRGLRAQINQVHKLSGGYSLEVLPNRDAPGVYYVVLYTDGARKRFIIQRAFAT
jgi:hypothetical protein